MYTLALTVWGRTTWFLCTSKFVVSRVLYDTRERQCIGSFIGAFVLVWTLLPRADTIIFYPVSVLNDHLDKVHLVLRDFFYVGLA